MRFYQRQFLRAASLKLTALLKNYLVSNCIKASKHYFASCPCCGSPGGTDPVPSSCQSREASTAAARLLSFNLVVAVPGTHKCSCCCLRVQTAPIPALLGVEVVWLRVFFLQTLICQTKPGRLPFCLHASHIQRVWEEREIRCSGSTYPQETFNGSLTMVSLAPNQNSIMPGASIQPKLVF